MIRQGLPDGAADDRHLLLGAGDLDRSRQPRGRRDRPRPSAWRCSSGPICRCRRWRSAPRCSAMAAQNIGAGNWDRVGAITPFRDDLQSDHHRAAGRAADRLSTGRRWRCSSAANSPALPDRPAYPAARHLELPAVRGDHDHLRDGPGERRGDRAADHPGRSACYPVRLGFALGAYQWLGADAIWLSFPVGSPRQYGHGHRLLSARRLAQGTDADAAAARRKLDARRRRPSERSRAGPELEPAFRRAGQAGTTTSITPSATSIVAGVWPSTSPSIEIGKRRIGDQPELAGVEIDHGAALAGGAAGEDGEPVAEQPMPRAAGDRPGRRSRRCRRGASSTTSTPP